VQRTRKTIVEFLKRHGRATLDQLSSEIGVVPMTIRGHLSVLERDGMVCYEEERGKVGRPRFVYFLTQQAQEQFPKNYDSLCNRILDAVASCHGSVTALRLSEMVAENWAGERAERMRGKSLEEKVRDVAAIRSEEGAMASVAKTTDGYVIEQCHCPASCVAQRHPEIICAAEKSYIERLIGVPVERVTWKVEGGETCSYHVRQPVDPVDPQAT